MALHSRLTFERGDQRLRHLAGILLQRFGQLHRRGACQVTVRGQLRRLESGLQGTRRTDFLDR